MQLDTETHTTLEEDKRRTATSALPALVHFNGRIYFKGLLFQK